MGRKGPDRPKEIGQVEVLFIDPDGRPRRRRGPSIDDMLRCILFDLQEAAGLQPWVVMAERWGIRQQTVSDFLNGTTMKLATLSRLCAALGISVIELFEQFREPKPDGSPPALEHPLSARSKRLPRKP